MADDFYALLEVPRDASQDEIKTAFREKVQEYHPDHNDDPRANAQFTAVKKAYDTLGDPVERNAYDRMGHVDYVAKRLSGLPDPEKWAPETSEDASGSSTAASTGGTSTRRSASSGASSTGAGSTSRSGRSNSTSTSASTGTGRGTTGSGSTSTGSASTTGTSSSGSSRSGGSGTTSTGSTSSGRSVAYADDPIVDFVARHDWARAAVGWPLLYFVMAVYAAGLGAVVAANAEAFGDLVDRVGAAGADTVALRDALERESVPILYDAAIGDLLAGSTPGTVALAGGALIVLGAIVLPAVVFLLVYLTRLSPGWKPTYLYPVAVLGPLAGLAVGAGTAVPLVAELALFVVLPFGALLVMVLSAFVRPKLKSALFG